MQRIQFWSMEEKKKNYHSFLNTTFLFFFIYAQFQFQYTHMTHRHVVVLKRYQSYAR